MPAAIDSVTTGNDYTGAATISEVYESAGGFFVITGNDAFVQLQAGPHGLTAFYPEVHVPVGNGILEPGTTGIRFRNYVAGQAAVVSAALYFNSEPVITVTSPGSVTAVVTASTLTGWVSGAGAILGGTGFAVVRNSAGNYTVTFTTPYPATPLVLAVAEQAGAQALSIGSVTSGGFTVVTFDSASSLAVDLNFMFTAQVMV